MNNIKLYRGEKGWTQIELANAMGITKTSVFNYESKKTNVATLANIAKTLGNCSVIEICGEDLFEVIPQNDNEIKQILKILAGLTSCPGLKSKLIELSNEECNKQC